MLLLPREAFRCHARAELRCFPFPTSLPELCEHSAFLLNHGQLFLFWGIYLLFQSWLIQESLTRKVSAYPWKMGVICQHHHSFPWWKEHIPWEAIKIPPEALSQHLCSEIVNLWAIKCHPYFRSGFRSTHTRLQVFWAKSDHFAVCKMSRAEKLRLCHPPWSTRLDHTEGKSSE